MVNGASQQPNAHIAVIETRTSYLETDINKRTTSSTPQYDYFLVIRIGALILIIR